MYLTLTLVTVFGIWVLLEMRKVRRLIRIPIIILLFFISLIAGGNICFSFFDMERYLFKDVMRKLEKEFRANNLYSVKASIITYNKASKDMNEYSALKCMYHALKGHKWTKRFYENDSLMQTNIKSKIIDKSAN